MKPGLVHGADLSYRIIGLAMCVHRRLGPGCSNQHITDAYAMNSS